MKDSMRSRLEQLARRLIEIDALLAEPEIASDMDRFRKLSRERAEIEPVVVQFQQYEATEGDIQ
ncbi:MAG TPA: peptide chain release factor 1, partial [Pusillimonas sp.]|nr:peptide chain release factor 1 [Pusillimonas sp.]